MPDEPKLTKKQKIKKDLNNAIVAQRNYKEMAIRLDKVYEGYYQPCTGATVANIDYSAKRVKSTCCSNLWKSSYPIHMPPRGDITIPLARNPENINDYYSAKTADSLLEYSLDKGGYREIEDAVRNMRLLNYGFIRMGFKR